MASKTISIGIIGRITGNVNADGVVGQRILIKKMYSTKGEVIPFVSARAVKRAIRDELMNRGFKIDPFIKGKKGALDLSDSGKPDEYVDNDLFGYMVPVSGERAWIRQAPVAISYFKALRDTPVRAEFGGRFPRPHGPSGDPVPFEVEVADFIGRVCSIVYDYIGDFTKEVEAGNNSIKTPVLSNDERRKRLGAFLDIFLTPSYVLPRRTNSLVMPEYILAVAAFSKVGPIPVCNYLDIDADGNVDLNLLRGLVKMKEKYRGDVEIFIIAYKDAVRIMDDPVLREIAYVVDDPDYVVNKLVDLMFPKE